MQYMFGASVARPGGRSATPRRFKPELKADPVEVPARNLNQSAEKELNGRKYHRVERYYGRFERSFNIPDDAESEGVHAEFKGGVLHAWEPAMAKNYYVILGVASDATLEEVKAAFRRRALELHPDRSGLESGPFLELQEAYGVLGDPVRRRTYDRQSGRPSARRRPWGPAVEPILSQRKRGEPLRPVAGADIPQAISLMNSFERYQPSFDELVDRLLSNFLSFDRPKAEGLRSLTVEVVLDAEAARFGGLVSVRIPARATCPNCGGRGGMGPYECWRCGGLGVLNTEYLVEVAYPPGCSDGQVVQMPLEGFGIENFYLTVVFRVSRGW
jgi:molecular chaperone DnaJ